MSIWEYANPKKFMQTSAGLLPWLWGLTGLCLAVGLIWGFFFTPDDFRQGSTVKIIYLHVPSAMMAIPPLAPGSMPMYAVFMAANSFRAPLRPVRQAG